MEANNKEFIQQAPPALLTVSQFCIKHAFITQGGLRFQIFNADNNGLALKIKMHPKLPALKMEYDRHKLTSPDTGATSIGTIHISVLNERRKRAGMELIEE